MSSENRSFEMHPNLLYDVIMRQAGTLQKAILEGVTNAVDAGATECRISLGTHHFSIEDDGRGFRSREEIEAWFETFGTPHQEGDAVFGKFRMGRGQLFSFGRNTWRSRQFQMDVDIKTSGLGYHLREHLEIFEGTRISVDLYDPIAPSDLERIRGELRKFVAWAQIRVLLDGELISRLPSSAKWDFEDSDAYFALSADRNQLAVYNLGVLVNSFWSGRFGMGGTVVTKRQIDLNFARNDIVQSCPVFRRIQNVIRKKSGTAAKKKTKLSDAERDLLVQEFLSGEIDVADAPKLRALTDVHGRSWPIDKLLQIPHKFGGKLIVAGRGDQMIETAQHRALAFSVDEATLERFGAADGESLLKRISNSAGILLEKHLKSGSYTMLRSKIEELSKLDDGQIDVVDRDYLRDFVSSDHIALAASELSADDKALLHSISAAYGNLVAGLNRIGLEDRSMTRRTIALGKSETALAWTDGTDMIWIDKDHARLLRRGYPGAYQIASTLLHEMLHAGPDTGTHEHDLEFYKAYHDLGGHPTDPIGYTAKRMVAVFITRLRQGGKRISAKLLELDDLDLELEKARAAIEEAPEDPK